MKTHLQKSNIDFYKSKYYKRANWFGFKKLAIYIIGNPIVNLIVKAIAPILFPIKMRRRIPIIDKEVRCSLMGYSFIMGNPVKCSIARELYWSAGKRANQDNQIAIQIFAELIGKYDCFLDIGSNTGMFSLLAGTINKRITIHAFEIVPSVYIMLNKNMILNDLVQRMSVYLLGIGKSGTVLRMPKIKKESVLPTAFSSKTKIDAGISIPMESLDLWSEKIKGIQKVFIKIDVEGTENDIFDNAQSFIPKYRPDILCEILPGESRVDNINQILKQNNYLIYKVTNDSLTRHETIIPDKNYHDWFFSSEDLTTLKFIKTPIR